MIYRISSSETNIKMLDIFLTKERDMIDTEVREKMVDTLVKRGVFFVPFDAYIRNVHGEGAREFFREYYNSEGCTMTGKLVIPLQTLDGELLGLLLYQKGIDGKYSYPVRGGFNKQRYLQTSRGAIETAIREKYVAVVEGVFDEIALNTWGIPTISLSGPTLHYNISSVLNIIPNKIIFSDMDKAGRELYKQCAKMLDGNIVCVNLPTKDVDEYMRKKCNVDKLISCIEENKKMRWVNNLIKVS